MINMLFPNGARNALTASYDDGAVQDRRLVELFNKAGIKGTFNLNSGNLGKIVTSGMTDKFGNRYKRKIIESDELKQLYEGHEVACHTLTHPFIGKLQKEMASYELLADKANLEKLVGYPVRGLAYPMGSHSRTVYEAMSVLGIEYGRTTVSTETFELPDNYLVWNPTCHHSNKNLMKYLGDFLRDKLPFGLKIFYLWGHSFEFDENENWDIIEEFSLAASRLTNVWFATNIQIIDYLNAVNSLKFSADGSIVKNSSGINVLLNINEKIVEISKGETLML